MIRYLLDEHVDPLFRNELLKSVPSLVVWRVGWGQAWSMIPPWSWSNARATFDGNLLTKGANQDVTTLTGTLTLKSGAPDEETFTTQTENYYTNYPSFALLPCLHPWYLDRIFVNLLAYIYQTNGFEI